MSHLPLSRQCQAQPKTANKHALGQPRPGTAAAHPGGSYVGQDQERASDTARPTSRREQQIQLCAGFQVQCHANNDTKLIEADRAQTGA